jgi:phosphoribosylglycinamide formyltransferase-1
MKHKPGLNNASQKTVVVLISGRGSNMQALLEADLSCCHIAAVISNRADAPGLAIAEHYGVDTHVVSHRDYPDRISFDMALASVLECYRPDLIALAGFMRILAPEFVSRYRDRLINIHPSLLPAYGGLDTHARVLHDGVKVHGCTVHFVTTDLDLGPIIIQSAVAVLMNDTPETLAARVLREEHRIYPQAVRWFCSGRLSLSEEGRVLLDHFEQPGAALVSPGLE